MLRVSGRDKFVIFRSDVVLASKLIHPRPKKAVGVWGCAVGLLATNLIHPRPKKAVGVCGCAVCLLATKLIHPRRDAVGVCLGSFQSKIKNQKSKIYAMTGSSNPLRCSRPTNWLASLSSKVSVLESKRSFLPVREEMFPAWHMAELTCPE